MGKEKLKWIVVIVCTVLAIAAVTWFKPSNQKPLYDEPSECQALMPTEVTQSDDMFYYALSESREALDFSKKEQLALDKYGFRRTFEVKEKVVLRQELFTCGEDYIYGIFADPGLNRSLKRIDTKEQWRIYNAIEMGADASDFPDYSEYIEMELEPGTYYLAVYTADKKKTGTVEYACRYFENK